jgi:hypothetical protein
MKMAALGTILLSDQSARLLSGDFIAVGAILVGFGLTVIMFRLQRELDVQEQHPQWRTWLAWSDYLILASMLLAVFFVVLPVLAFPAVTRMREALASAACISAIILGIPDDADQCSEHADHRFRVDGDHDSGMMPITRSGMMPIS